MTNQFEQFHVGVKGVYVRDQRVLSLYLTMADGKILWDFPGGRMNQGEEIEEALIREIGEELPSLRDVEIKDLLHSRRYYDYERDGSQMLRLFYLITGDLQEIKISDEHEGYEWLTLDEVHSMSIKNEKISDEYIIDPIIFEKALSASR